MIEKNPAALFTITGLIAIVAMFLNIVCCIENQNLNNNDAHIISAFDG
ncbi:MAG TPA: hypothetical protein P5556_04565 [Candidatus Gastranaerophilales bacterium]|nr:hypothetical protein [Candidatus Gastranaerophilales bacterium]